jgi:hypothetical protein
MIDTIALLFAITSAVWTGAACGNYLGRELALAWRIRHATRGKFSDTYFAPKTHYRRRIEQPKPEPKYAPFTWEDREQLRGRWVVQVESTGTEQMVNKLDLINNDLFANNKLALELLTGWRFLDTGEPVGKKVIE